MIHQQEALPPHILLPTDNELRRLSRPMPPPHNCFVCRGTRKYRWYSPAVDLDGVRSSEVVDWECNCEQQFILGSYLLSRGVTLRQMTLGWDDLTGVDQSLQTRAVHAWAIDYLVRAEWLVRRGIGAVMFGSSGTGKSLISNLMLRSLMRDGWDGYQIDINSFVTLTADGWKDGDLKSWFDKRVRHAPILVIDELGKENVKSEFAVRELNSLLHERYDNLRPTFITTNLSMTDLRQRYGSVVMDIIEGPSSVYEFSGASWRENARSRDTLECDLGLTRPIVWG